MRGGDCSYDGLRSSCTGFYSSRYHQKKISSLILVEVKVNFCVFNVYLCVLDVVLIFQL